ncbi:MAG: alpha/beta fold hydrolase [Actinomycetales bacterium]
MQTSHFSGADGTQVGYHVVGQGPPLVIVHGSITEAADWFAVAGELAEQFTCHVLDRRGRGASGDDERYALATEASDIATLLEIAGPGSMLLGHSYGAICTLEAVRLSAVPSALLLYEPPLPIESPTAGEHLAPYAQAIADGDADAAMLIACEHFLRVSPEETAMMQGSPLWPHLCELAPTWTRELREIDLTKDRLGAYADLSVPTLLLVGEQSPSHLVGASHWLDERMPDSRLVVLPGQGHLANILAPALLADAIRDFAATPR